MSFEIPLLLEMSQVLCGNLSQDVTSGAKGFPQLSIMIACIADAKSSLANFEVAWPVRQKPNGIPAESEEHQNTLLKA